MKIRMMLATLAAGGLMMVGAPTASYAGGMAHAAAMCPLTWLSRDRAAKPAPAPKKVVVKKAAKPAPKKVEKKAEKPVPKK